LITWYYGEIHHGLSGAKDAEEVRMRFVANVQRNVDFKFHYLLAINTICFVIRILSILQYNEKIGPLIKILDKMAKDFSNFLILFMLLVITFATIGNFNFILLPEFEGFLPSVFTVFNTSLGNFDLKIFDELANEDLKMIGKVYFVVIIIIFNLLLMNLIISMLANTYSIYD